MLISKDNSAYPGYVHVFHQTPPHRRNIRIEYEERWRANASVFYLKPRMPAILPNTVDVKALGTPECTAERLQSLARDVAKSPGRECYTRS